MILTSKKRGRRLLHATLHTPPHLKRLRCLYRASIFMALLLMGTRVWAQQPYSLQQCLQYAVEHNKNIQKSTYDREKASYARQEIIGALLPQINGSANLNNNLKKAKFVMPNFMNNMLPPDRQDPNAPKYMTIEMGTKYTLAAGISLNQQLLNLPLWNALDIAKVAEEMAALGEKSTQEDVIGQVANLFYSIQVTEYASQQMNQSVTLVEKMLRMMETNYANGLVKKVDVDRVKVNLTNLKTQQRAIAGGLDVQKNLLKLQMGLPIKQSLTIPPMDIAATAQQVTDNLITPFSITQHTTYNLLQEKEKMARLQRRAKIYEYIPSLSLVFNAQYNQLSDQFFKGANNYGYNTAMIGVSLRVPIFSGLSRYAKERQSHLELLKAQEDVQIIKETLQMAHQNAELKLLETQRTISVQNENKRLAEEVFRIAQKNLTQGVASLSDVLNASQALVQAQLSYASALGDYLKAYIELKKANGELLELMTIQK